jgi:cytochrome c553
MSIGTRFFLLFIVWHFAVLLAADEPLANDYFESKIRPLFANRCWECHGPDEQWNGLRLDSPVDFLRGGDFGPPVVPGDPEASLLMKAVQRTGELKMPPDDPLSADEIESIRQWIADGASWPATMDTGVRSLEQWRTHWAFQPLGNPSPPAVDDGGWCQTPIDAFIFAELARHELRPSPVADRRTLIRRLTVDLTGLPPTREAVEAFVHDSRPNAYERLVDDLLSSPAYGQQFARNWLDIARYSDTKGYVYAREERFFVHSAAYRNWVIDAFNSDLPYDRFIQLQLAADQIAAEEPASLAAMGFLTLGRRFLGVTHDIIDDRIDVVCRGIMGLTVACARCHDHKFDPIPTADYYSLYGVFQNSLERQVELPHAGTSGKSDEAFRLELQKRQQALAEKLASSRAEASDRARERLADYLFAQSERSKYPEEGFDQVLARTDLIPAFVRRWEGYLAKVDADRDPIFGPWFRFASIQTDAFAAESPAVHQQILAESAYHPWVRGVLSDAPHSLRDVADRYGQLFARVLKEHRQPSNEPPASSGENKPTGQTLAEPFLNVLFGHTSPCETPDESIVSIETYFDSETTTQIWNLQGEIDRWRLQNEDVPSVAVGLFDRTVLQEPRIFRRGNPATKGDFVARHSLSLLHDGPPVPFLVGSGRREFAEQLTDPKNPLTMRVWVNRIWQHHFGVGLVRTPSDFGLRSEPPSHPELLDWLAGKLRENHWSTKSIHRLIVLSAAYRQSSRVAGDPGIAKRSTEIDPDNHKLWRMSPRRLRFEELRDGLLSVAGDLDRRDGGKPAELFSADDRNHRRTIFGLVDRQFLPGTLRLFDFANPDLHIARRSETTVPQQALYFLNHPFVAARARSLIAHLHLHDQDQIEESDAVESLFHAILQREPTAHERAAAAGFLAGARPEEPVPLSRESQAWSYGYGELDGSTGRLRSFTPLPYFSGSAWQGGESFPDAKLGWVQVSALGGHPGNDLQHSCIRRWIAPESMRVSIESLARHEPDVSDGVGFRIVSSRHGMLLSQDLKASEARLDLEHLDVEAGDTIDFVVEVLQELNSDQHLWAPKIRELAITDPDTAPQDPRSLEPARAATDPRVWDAERDFVGPPPQLLNRLEQLAQTLMLTNEFLFVD